MEEFVPTKKCIVMTRDEVRSFDSWAINTVGIAGVVLMENAGASCAELVKEKLTGLDSPKVCIFCGTGNNGGDGYVIARHLLNSKFKVTVVICGDRKKIKGDAKINLDTLEQLAPTAEQFDLDGPDVENRVKAYTDGCDMLVDSIFGTGLQGELYEKYQKLIESINARNLPILAVDIPSGLDCDSGRPLGMAIKADYTVTFVAVKKGFTVTDTAGRYTGQIFVASIGIDPSE